LAVTFLTILRAAALKADDGCDRCGCVLCRRVSRVVREMKKVMVAVYTYESDRGGGEPGQPCGETCDRHGDCNETGASGCCVASGAVAAATMAPGRPRLVKQEQIKEVPTYKWVVEYLCEDCASMTEGREMDPAAVQPPQSRQPRHRLLPVPGCLASPDRWIGKIPYLLHV
jgi:hypothetical protein